MTIDKLIQQLSKYPPNLDLSEIKTTVSVEKEIGMNRMRSVSPFTPDELVSCDPMQMIYDDVNHIARFEQTLHIRMTQEVIENALQMATDKQLQDELKRRANERKALKEKILRCRDCKYCGEGYCSIAPRWGKTTVCLKRPKPTAGNDRYYATNQSRKACEMFEAKTEQL